MEPLVRYEREGSVGLIAVDNPPVNALSQPVRAGLLAALEAALADPEAKVLALYGKGRTFIAGADIKEFGKPPAEPTLRQVIERFENAKKAIVAVLHGTALGGGLELALGCHYRIALPGAKVGLPEVKLGLLPGAGGTQRLPRLTGVEAAIEMITSGRHVEAEEAAKLGIVDALVHETDPHKAAVGYGSTVAIDNASVKRVRDLDQKLKVPPGTLEAEKKKVAQRYRGRFSPMKCVEAVEAAVTLPFDQGLKRERELFDQCMASPQRKALIHVFFGERAVAKVPGMDEVEPRPVKEAAVIGAGTMGGGIAMCFANAGIPVTLMETSREALERGLERIRGNYEGSVKRGSLPLREMEKRMTLIRPSLDLATVATADLIIEAVFEKMEVKQEVFAKLDELAKSGAVLATNTSYLDVDRIAAATSRPQDVLGMHFFSPANVMRLLEVVRAAKTADDALKTALAVGRQLGKVAVVSGVCDGFIGNRMLRYYQRQSYYMLEDGALPQEIDAAVTAFGFAMGPFAVGDLAGLDISYANRRREDGKRDPAERYVELPDKVVELGRLGQKSGAGWYRYEKGDRTPHPDPEIEELILATSREKGIVRRSFSKEEILTRLLTALVNEGAKILGEGIALRSVDIDMVWINGYGFPAHEGGPMFWADQRGLAKVLADVERFRRDDAWAWRPAPLLVQLAREGKGFGDIGTA
ncbi:MAG TPA: 3-hydroxyacyl-CoA dehydrogenase NAD-binding domain-containing protein [Kiloniellales bacterium]|nr:3-hydroxyacyl-CoA dehydrogenase NAD-binding domain-containing protein [Kiloniellales bacterium]